MQFGPPPPWRSSNMIWSRLRKMAISLPAALLAVVLLVGIN